MDRFKLLEVSTDVLKMIFKKYKAFSIIDTDKELEDMYGDTNIIYELDLEVNEDSEDSPFMYLSFTVYGDDGSEACDCCVGLTLYNIPSIWCNDILKGSTFEELNTKINQKDVLIIYEKGKGELLGTSLSMLNYFNIPRTLKERLHKDSLQVFVKEELQTIYELFLPLAKSIYELKEMSSNTFYYQIMDLLKQDLTTI